MGLNESRHRRGDSASDSGAQGEARLPPFRTKPDFLTKPYLNPRLENPDKLLNTNGYFIF